MTSTAACHPQRLGPRLADSRRFAWLRTQGRRAVQGCLIGNWAPAHDSGVSRVGVVTSRKVGSAVERSRARRLLREAYRRHRSVLVPAVDLVLVARPSIRGQTLAIVERDFVRFLQKAGFSLRPGS